MPVIVIGADTLQGRAVVDALLPRGGELRAFISNGDEYESLKQRGVKVAIGDVSDGSHVGGAAMRAFCAVVIPEAAFDDRERSFASTPEDVVSAWAEGLQDAAVQRIIWLEDERLPTVGAILEDIAPETAGTPTTDRTPSAIGEAVASLDGKKTLNS